MEQINNNNIQKKEGDEEKNWIIIDKVSDETTIVLKDIAIPPKQNYRVGIEFILDKKNMLKDILSYQFGFITHNTLSKRRNGTKMMFNLRVMPAKRNNWIYYILTGFLLIMCMLFIVLKKRK